jgi:hypothetical protein
MIRWNHWEPGERIDPVGSDHSYLMMALRTFTVWPWIFSFGVLVVLLFGLLLAVHRKWKRAEKVLWILILCWPF